MNKSTHTPEYAKLRELLVQARSTAQLSQRDLALLLKVHPSWVAKVETGERRLDVIEFLWFLAACNADPRIAVANLVGGTRKGRTS